MFSLVTSGRTGSRQAAASLLERASLLASVRGEFMRGAFIHARVLGVERLRMRSELSDDWDEDDCEQEARRPPRAAALRGARPHSPSLARLARAPPRRSPCPSSARPQTTPPWRARTTSWPAPRAWAGSAATTPSSSASRARSTTC
jgi:hypothetical protein